MVPVSFQEERNDDNRGSAGYYPDKRTDHASGEAGLFSLNSATKKGHVKKPFPLLNMH